MTRSGQLRRPTRIAVFILTGAAVALGALAAAGPHAQGSFYMEVQKEERIYVFNLMSVYEQWKTTGEMGKSITRVDAGPKGETVIFDSEEAIHLYNFKHDLPGEVIFKPEEKKPVMNISWKDGKTTIETDHAALTISNRIQIRFSDDQPEDTATLDTQTKGSFRNRRVKTKFEGWIYNKALTYDLQLNWADTSSSLEDADLNFDFTKGKKAIQIKGGQFKVPFGRQELTSSGSQQFVDRSIVSAEFEKGRDQGVQLWGQTPKGTIEWRGGVFNGNGRNTQVNDNSHYQFDARVTWQPLGDVKYSESDFESTTKPLVAIAAQFETNDNHDRIDATDQVNRTVYGGDIVFKFKGVSVFGEYFHRVNEPELSEEFRTDGYAGQIGVFIFRRFVELAVRYATVRGKDSPAVIVPARDNDRTERGAALNWFMNKHSLKLQADYRRIENEALDVTNDEYRLQMQFIF